MVAIELAAFVVEIVPPPVANSPVAPAPDVVTVVSESRLICEPWPSASAPNAFRPVPFVASPVEIVVIPGVSGSDAPAVVTLPAFAVMTPPAVA